MANDKKKSAPEATRCEAGGGSCGAGQPLYVTDGLVHCEHHSSWPESKEGRIMAATRKIEKE
jgi:hypothetical protein